MISEDFSMQLLQMFQEEIIFFIIYRYRANTQVWINLKVSTSAHWSERGGCRGKLRGFVKLALRERVLTCVLWCRPMRSSHKWFVLHIKGIVHPKTNIRLDVVPNVKAVWTRWLEKYPPSFCMLSHNLLRILTSNFKIYFSFDFVIILSFIS